MTDTGLLREVISESGLKLGFIADELGITRYALALKINNETEFKASEIFSLQKILNLSNSKRDKIFFAIEVD